MLLLYDDANNELTDRRADTSTKTAASPISHSFGLRCFALITTRDGHFLTALYENLRRT